jgi:tRNA (guanine-N7-)-methyltransferase
MSFDRESNKFRTFGRAKGRPLSPHVQAVWDETFPKLKWDIDAPLSDLEAKDKLWLEIGFGGAEHLLWQAEAHPDIHLIGAEPFMNGVAKAVRGAAEANLTNLSLHHGDVRDVLAALPDHSLSRIFILFPDPWPKSRHNKRRLLRSKFIGELYRVLKPGGELRFASDIIHYVDWTLSRLKRFSGEDGGGWEFTHDAVDQWRVRGDDWPGTRYEAKAGREGRPCHYFKFRKTEPNPK